MPGSELFRLPFSEMPPGIPYPKEAKDRVMHSKLMFTDRFGNNWMLGRENAK